MSADIEGQGVRGLSECRSSTQRVFVLAGATLLLLLVVCTSATFAEQGEGAVPPGPSLEEVRDASESGAVIVPMPAPDTEAAEALPTQDLTREQSNELLSGVFGPVLPAPTVLPENLQVEEFYSDNVALVIDLEGQNKPALLESTVPLRADGPDGGQHPLDLSLLRDKGDLTPANPLVDVEIPARLGEGLHLPESKIKIDLPDAPAEISPSTVDESVATYPNVAEDTMFAVAPTPTGLETFTLLQSSDAPTVQRFSLSLPVHGALHAAENGGAEIREEDRLIARILPPNAIDAAGSSVPVHLEIEDHGFSLVTEPEAETEFPILVDPIFETYAWRQGSSAGAIGNDWLSFRNSSQFQAFGNGYCPACGGWADGLVLQSGNEWASAGSQARWDYHVPRWAGDLANPAIKARPESFVRGVTFWNLNFDTDSGLARPITTDPFMAMYIWDESNGFVAIGKHLGTSGDLSDLNYQYKLVNPNESAGAKQASLELVTTQNQMSQYRNLYVGNASIELSDHDVPRVGMVGNPSTWVNDKPLAVIPFAFADAGLGVSRAVVEQPSNAGAWRTIQTGASCTGGFSSACPAIWEHTTSGRPKLSYDPTTMPQGEQWLRIDIFDPLGRQSITDDQTRVKVDHTPPDLTLAGRVTEQAKFGTTASKYTLKYSAVDGDHEVVSPVSPIGSPGIASGQMQRPSGVAVDSSGNLWVVDRENNRIQKFDSSGKLLLQFGTSGQGAGQFSDPRGIAITPAGTVWISEVGNKRLQAFTLKGEFLRTLTSAVFVNPYGVASGPGNVLWISDPGAHDVFKFSESGTFLEALASSSKNPDLEGPLGLATDVAGRIWVVDNSANRVNQYNAAGEYLTKLGSYGIADGQFKGPIGVAITASGNLLVTDDLNNRIQEFEVSGQFLRKFGALGSELGQVNQPRGVAVGPSGVAYVADAGNQRVARWTHSDYDPQSGVVATEVKVDGLLVEPRYEPGCATSSCAVTRELTLNSSDYASGTHTLSVTAKDKVGLPTTRTQSFTTVRDTKAPEITISGSFFNGPEGWLEQKYYFAEMRAKDAGGYGVSTLIFKIDGSTVWSTSQSCPSGACEASIAQILNVAQYKGGAHPYEVVATDVGGNVAKKTGIVNVDPKGQVSVAEAANTLEAAEATSGSEVVTGGFLPEEAGASPPSLEASDGGFTSVDSPVPSSTGSEITDGIVMETADGLIKIDPLTASSDAPPPGLVAGGDALVTGNSSAASDLVVRPVYAGIMAFQAIRDTAAPTEYSWEVRLEPDQSLVQIDSQFAQVYTDGTHPSFGIRVTNAHDAVGTSVPTTLSVSQGKFITLTVHHRPVSGQPGFVYPVVAGTGWEGGFQTHHVEMPPADPPVTGRDIEEYFGGYGGVSPPLPIDGSDPEASASGTGGVKKWFLWVECSHTGRWIEEASGVREPEAGLVEFADWTEDCGNPFQNKPGKGIAYRAAYHGKYFIKEGIKVWHEGGPTDGIGCKTDTRKDVANPANLEEGVSWKQRRSYIDRCVWWGQTPDGGGQSAPYGKHITPVGRFVGEMRGGCGDSCGGTPNPWKQFAFPPMAYYLWASGHVKFHQTDCIDCY